MMISRHNSNIIGWRETYISKDEIVDVSVNGNINTITTRNRTTGRVDSKMFFFNVNPDWSVRLVCKT